MASSGLIIGLIARKIRKEKQKKVNNKFYNYEFHLGEMTSHDVKSKFTQRNIKTIDKKEKYHGKKSN